MGLYVSLYKDSAYVEGVFVTAQLNLEIGLLNRVLVYYQLMSRRFYLLCVTEDNGRSDLDLLPENSASLN
jgi:hypothetical protein